MKKVGEVLANSIENLHKSHSGSHAWKMTNMDKESLGSLSVEQLRDLAFELSCAYVDVVYSIGRMKDFIKFVRDNEVVQG